MKFVTVCDRATGLGINTTDTAADIWKSIILLYEGASEIVTLNAEQEL